MTPDIPATTEHRPGRGRRAAASTVLALVVLALAPATSAKPTREEIEDAQARIQEMDQRLGLLVEQYDQTQVALDELQAQLAELRAAIDRARAAEAQANQRLATSARAAYMNQGSSFGLLLSSKSFSILSDRLYYLDTVARQQDDIAVHADVAAEEAHRAAAQLQVALSEQRVLLDRLGEQRAEIEAGIADQEAMVQELEEELQQQIRERRQAELAAQQAAQQAAPQGPAPVAADPPAISGQGAAAAIAAAESVLGVPYQYAGASPETGFDCSGLTMWAWAHGGVSLPHSSQMQYASLPHVSQSQVQPGDLIFFYSPISHVGLYVGGGMMIHAPHTGSVVSRVAVYWEYFAGAARPG
jgi:cell wall-associated NlpC family hydrolase